jgi:hypothetical protein
MPMTRFISLRLLSQWRDRDAQLRCVGLTRDPAHFRGARPDHAPSSVYQLSHGMTSGGYASCSAYRVHANIMGELMEM